MNIQYRPAEVTDLEDICAMVSEAIPEMERHGIFQWDEVYPQKEDFERDLKNHALYLALSEKHLVAVYVISCESDEAYGNGAWQYAEDKACVLHRFCVNPRVQNQGIGKQVLRHVEEEARGMGYESMRLDVFSRNPFAQKLYRNDGFAVTGYVDWRKGRFDLMEKKL